MFPSSFIVSKKTDFHNLLLQNKMKVIKGAFGLIVPFSLPFLFLFSVPLIFTLFLWSQLRQRLFTLPLNGVLITNALRLEIMAPFGPSSLSVTVSTFACQGNYIVPHSMTYALNNRFGILPTQLLMSASYSAAVTTLSPVPITSYIIGPSFI